MIQSAITKQIEAIIAAYGNHDAEDEEQPTPDSVRSGGNPNKTIGLFDRFFELGDTTSALSNHRVQPVS